MNKETTPEPSNLAPDASIGELVTEIDRTRHEAARTVAALTKKIETSQPVSPTAAAKAVGTVTQRARQVPKPVWLGAVLVLVVWLRRRRRVR